MGVLIKQSFWGSAFMYGGVAIGYINTLVLMPAYLDIDQIGLIRLIQANAIMLVPLAMIGMGGSIVRYYPTLKSDTTLKNSVITLHLIILGVMNLLLIGFTAVFFDFISGFFAEKSSTYNDYLFITLIILLFQSYFEYLFNISRSELNIIFPSFLKEIFLRSTNVVLVLMYGFGIINFELVIYFLTGIYLLNTLIFFSYIKVKTKISFSFRFSEIDKDLMKGLINFAGFTLVVSLGVSVINNVGYVLTSSYLGLEANGVFTICSFIGIIIEMPKRAASQVIGPLVSSKFKDGLFTEVEDIYQRTSLNLGIVSILLAIGIFSNLRDLFLFIPKGEILNTGYYVVIAIGLSKVVSMFFGPSGEILIYSEYKKYLLLIMICSAAFMIISNIILIQKFGLTGAAIASFLTVLIDNLFRFYLLKIKFNFQLFSIRHLKLLIVSIATWYIIINIPFSNFTPIIAIIIRSVTITVLFLGIIYLLRISNEFNAIVAKALETIKRRND